MGEKLYVFGTGNAITTHCYNTCFAIDSGDEYFMVDAGGGNGILKILEDMCISCSHIHNIFVSHEHSDHVLGIVWMVRIIGSMINSARYEGICNLYCHAELKTTITQLVKLTLGKKIYGLLGDKIIIHAVEDGESREILGHRVNFFDIHSSKAKQFGFNYLLGDGQLLSFTGDEPLNPACTQYVSGCQWLLAEAFCLYDEKDIFKPYEKHHSTVKDASLLAQSLGVPNTVLWHTEDKNIKNRKKLYTAEAKKYYNGNIYVPDDGEIILLN